MNKSYLLWGIWLVAMIAAGVWLARPLITQENQSVFLAGDMSSGHHQIELACSSCHISPFGGSEVIQEACVNCHGAELDAVSDSHPGKKFIDPRNADRVEKLDARYCVTCHREHQLERTREMGVTLPQDFCFHCHEDIAEQRETHRDMDFDSCASAGCHNYHDNSALYEDFLLRHGGDPWLNEMRRVAALTPALRKSEPLATGQYDAPQLLADSAVVEHWSLSAHAAAGINCSDCHNAVENWQPRPGPEKCMGCHQAEVDSFGQGKHGMRFAQGLAAMAVKDARSQMRGDAAHETLSCSSCHGPHDTDTRFAAVQACQGCHDSEHVRQYDNSPHAKASAQALAAGRAHEAVTCATCHMPRMETEGGVVQVNHNQSENLRPNEKMIRPVCMNCHGLGFAIDALADRALIESNFNGRPAQKIPSIEMARERAARAPGLDEAYR